MDTGTNSEANLLNQHVKHEEISSYEKQIYDLKQLLEISKSLSSVLEFKTLIESILYICMCQMRTLSAGIFTEDGLSATAFTLGTNYSNMELDPNVDYSIAQNHPAIALLENTNYTYSYDELIDILKENAKGIECLATLNPSLLIPVKAKNHLNGLLVLGERIDLGEGNVYSNAEREQILNIASLAAIAINNTQLLDKASTDMMTHLRLKHYFFTVLIDKLDQANINETPVSILMLDIDFFKKFNDTYGHACGDLVLKTVASIIKSSVRQEDMAARYGGEEFVVMLYDAPQNIAFEVAERIRKNIEQMLVEFEGHSMHVTISIGGAVHTNLQEESALELVEKADQALYVSKKNGRNRTSFYGVDSAPQDNAQTVSVQNVATSASTAQNGVKTSAQNA